MCVPIHLRSTDTLIRLHVDDRGKREKLFATMGWKLVIRNTLDSVVHYLRLARLLRISPGETSVPSTFRFIRFHNRPESVIERKQRRMAARRKEKVRGRRQEAKRSAGCRISLALLFLGARSSFFVRSCKVFLAGILPRDSAGALAPVTRPQQSSIISIYPLRCFVFCRPSLTYTWIVAPLSSNLFPTSFCPSLVAAYLCLRGGGGGGNEDDGSSSWWRRVPEFQTSKL